MQEKPARIHSPSLHKAAMFGCARAAKALIENGADVNKGDNFGNTPLHMAIISGGDVKVIETLIAKANLCVKSNKGQNALHVAVKHHRIDTIKLIVNHLQITAVISDPDDKGYTPRPVVRILGGVVLFQEKVDLFKLKIVGICLHAGF